MSDKKTSKATYEILRSPKLEILEAQVNDSLDAGFQLQGGVCEVYRTDKPDAPFVYYQAIVGTAMR